MADVDFFVIGAQKCATSWLYYCLKEHPDILLPDRKTEADYYGGPRFCQLGETWFEGLYSPKPTARLRGSVSVDYLHDAQALKTVTERFPAARMILSVRHPLERIASAHGFLVRRGVLAWSGLSHALACALDDLEAGVSSPASELVTRSLYGNQMRVLADADALQRILVVSYEFLRTSPLPTLQAVYDFLGVDAGYKPRNLAVKPKRNANIPLLTRLERLLPSSYVLAKTMDYANRLLSATPIARPYEALEPAVESRLRTVLHADALLFARLLSQIPPARKIGGRKLTDAWGFRH